MFVVKFVREHSDMCAGTNNEYSVTTDRKTVGELIRDIESENAKHNKSALWNPEYCWRLWKTLGRCGSKANVVPMDISSYWAGHSRDHSKYDAKRIVEVFGSRGWYSPIEIDIVIDGAEE